MVQGQTSQHAASEEVVQEDEQGDREADESLAETESALAGAQDSQQQAAQAQQQALAEERRDLMQLRQHLQQQSGQPAHILRKQTLHPGTQVLPAYMCRSLKVSITHFKFCKVHAYFSKACVREQRTKTTLFIYIGRPRHHELECKLA